MSGMKFSELFDSALVQRVVGFTISSDEAKETEECNDFIEFTDTASVAIGAGLGWFVGGNPTQCHTGNGTTGSRCLGRAMWGSLLCPLHYGTLYPHGR